MITILQLFDEHYRDDDILMAFVDGPEESALNVHHVAAADELKRRGWVYVSSGATAYGWIHPDRPPEHVYTLYIACKSELGLTSL